MGHGHFDHSLVAPALARATAVRVAGSRTSDRDWRHTHAAGWTEAQALGRDIVDLTPTEYSRDDADAIMRKLRRGESWSGEFQLQDHEGSRFLAHVTNIPVRDDAGELIGIIGVSLRMEYLEPR